MKNRLKISLMKMIEINPEKLRENFLRNKPALNTVNLMRLGRV
jgi:hypothetical protein